MPRLQLVQTGVIYRNPLPGHQYVLAMMPALVDLGADELFAVYVRGSALYARDLVLAAARSTDGGRTWRQEALVHDPARDGRRYAYSGPALTRRRDGSLLLVAIRWDRSDPERLITNQQTGGILPGDTVFWRSHAGGRTWSGPTVVPVPPGRTAFPTGPILELRDGRWFLAFDVVRGYDDPEPVGPRLIGRFSADQGERWSDPVDLAVGGPEGKGYWHANPVELADGRILALAWTGDLRTGAFLPNHRLLSDPGGRTWRVEPTNLPGQTNGLADLGGGRVVAVYTWRVAERPGIMAALSEDEGRSWDLARQLRLWDATGQETIGTAATDTYPASHDVIAFGAPRASLAQNGDVLACWWCTDRAVTHVRWARLRLDRGAPGPGADQTSRGSSR